MIKYFLVLPVVFLIGCEQRYRYPCQDMQNWSSPKCQKPLCDIHKECPEQIFGEYYETYVKSIIDSKSAKGVTK